MQQSSVVDGMNVPIDAFSLPAVNRNVKTVLFAPQQTAQLRVSHGFTGYGVLFAVADSHDRVLPHAIGMVGSGERIALAGVSLTPDVETFPAVTFASAPLLPAVVAGFFLWVAGLAALKRRPA
jgi:hypothetical protein